jgi:hypothetical protein
VGRATATRHYLTWLVYLCNCDNAEAGRQVSC